MQVIEQVNCQQSNVHQASESYLMHGLKAPKATWVALVCYTAHTFQGCFLTKLRTCQERPSKSKKRESTLVKVLAILSLHHSWQRRAPLGFIGQPGGRTPSQTSPETLLKNLQLCMSLLCVQCMMEGNQSEKFLLMCFVPVATRMTKWLCSLCLLTICLAVCTASGLLV